MFFFHFNFNINNQILLFFTFLILNIFHFLHGEYGDITTIYKLQIDHSNDNLSQNIITFTNICNVYIHTGSKARYVPIILKNKIIHPKNNIKLFEESDQNETLEQNNKLIKELMFDVNTSIKYKDKDFEERLTEQEQRDKDSFIIDDLVLNSDSIRDTKWIVENLQMNDIVDFVKKPYQYGNIFSKLIFNISIIYASDTAYFKNLANIVNSNIYNHSIYNQIDNSNNSSKKNINDNNVPNIIQLGKLFEKYCENCEFDYYKTKNDTHWYLTVMRNPKKQYDSRFEENIDTENEINNKNKTVEEYNDSEYESLERKDLNAQFNKTAITNRTNGESYSEVDDDDEEGTMRTKRESKSFDVPANNKLLLLSYEDDFILNEPIMNVLLTNNKTYIFKIEYTLQSYFQIFINLEDIPNILDVTKSIDVTIRGDCGEQADATKYYIDINIDGDFKTFSFDNKYKKNQVIEFIIRNKNDIKIVNEDMNYEVQLNGTLVMNLQLQNICPEPVFSKFQFDLHESVKSLLEVSNFPWFKGWAKSPWIQNINEELCLTIIYINPTDDVTDKYTYDCYDPGAGRSLTVDIETKETKEVRRIQSFCRESNGEITRIIIQYKPTNTEGDVKTNQTIRFVLNIIDDVYIRYIYATQCNFNGIYHVKKDAYDSIDKIAYDLAYNYNLYDNKKTQNGVDYCLNNGKLINDSICICTIGFIGDRCEIPCGINKFGLSCTESCSPDTTSDIARGCKGMLLCTPQCGCSCGPGFKGSKCTESCSIGYYGSNCQSKCGKCFNKTTCDIYTGYCEKCLSIYLIPPYCHHSYPYVTKPLRVSNITHFSVQLEIDFHPNNIKGFSYSSKEPYYYYILILNLNTNTKEGTSTKKLEHLYNNIKDQINNKTTRNYTRTEKIDNLIPGYTYSFRLILLDKKDKTHDPLLSPSTEVITTCMIPINEYKWNLNITSTTIKINWKIIKTKYNSTENIKSELKKKDKNQVVSQLNKLFNNNVNNTNKNLTTKYIEVIEDLHNLTKIQFNTIFRCKYISRYKIMIKRIKSNQKTEEHVYNNINNGFLFKYLDPGNKYLIRVFINTNKYIDNEYIMIYDEIVNTKNEYSFINDVKIVEQFGNYVSIMWNIDKDEEKHTKVQILKNQNNNKKQQKFHEKRRLVFNYFKNYFINYKIYYIKYKIIKQRSCNNNYEYKTKIIETREKKYKLILNYFTTYSLFITEYKGQTLSNKYLKISLNASVPSVSPNNLYINEITTDFVHLMWSSLGITNFECRFMNGIFLYYQIELINMSNKTINNNIEAFNTEYNINGTTNKEITINDDVKTFITDDNEIIIENLLPSTNYTATIRYVNHIGMSNKIYSNLTFQTLPLKQKIL